VHDWISPAVGIWFDRKSCPPLLFYELNLNESLFPNPKLDRDDGSVLQSGADFSFWKELAPTTKALTFDSGFSAIFYSSRDTVQAGNTASAGAVPPAARARTLRK
jgi:hypothetical protein